MIAAYNILIVSPEGYKPGLHNRIIVTRHANEATANAYGATVQTRGSKLSCYAFVGTIDVCNMVPPIPNALGEVTLQDLDRESFPVPMHIRNLLSMANE